NKWNDTSREVHEMFKTTPIDTLKQDKKCQACWYMILSTMSGSTTARILHFCNYWFKTEVKNKIFFRLRHSYRPIMRSQNSAFASF
ncbi:MAG: hypothetical protein WBF33_25915, partial [Candidatus Nitrosopolaris sp.]